MHFDQFIQYRALSFKFEGFKATDFVLERSPDVVAGKLRTVCTAILPSVFDELEQLCQTLGITKRRFAELALIDAIERARLIIKDVDAFEFVRPDHLEKPV
jgi:hypothetical protein